MKSFIIALLFTSFSNFASSRFESNVEEALGAQCDDGLGIEKAEYISKNILKLQVKCWVDSLGLIEDTVEVKVKNFEFKVEDALGGECTDGLEINALRYLRNSNLKVDASCGIDSVGWFDKIVTIKL